MPAINPIPPNVLIELLVMAGWTVVKDGKYNCTLTKDSRQLSVPKRGRVLALEAFEDILTKADLEPGQFLELLPKTGFSYYDTASN